MENNGSEKINTYQEAWKKFRSKMDVLRKRQKEVLDRIFSKLDQKKIEIIRKKLQK